MDASYEKMSASLGSLLLLWAAIEQAARQEVVRVRGEVPKSAHGIAATLRTWESTVAEAHDAPSLGVLLAKALHAKLRGPLEVRNGLCHGLVGISAARADLPASLKWELNGAAHAITWDELQASFGWLSKVPRALSLISTPSSETPAGRMIDAPENREWWRAEFALDLSSL